jgi:glycosyltransferase involved in cell wall biosynthesis
MRILLITQSKRPSGITLYRQLMPHAYFKSIYPESEVEQIIGADYNNVFSRGDEVLNYDIAILSREVSPLDGGVKTIQRLQSLGIKVILDVDDYWELPSWHKLTKAYDYYNIPQLIKDNIKAADYVTTTTHALADLINPINDKVMVFPNCVDKTQPQFTIENIPTDRMRFGWIGGVHHRKDIEPLERSFDKLYKSGMKFQICLGGFNPNQEYKAIEKIFTSNYKLDYDYANYLKQFTPLLDHYSNGKPYRRLWAKDVFNYVKMYNEIDVSLVPLRFNQFSACKSELKIVEAAAMGKCVIVSDTPPYNSICNSSNSILIPHDAPHRDWFEAMKFCIDNPDEVKKLAEQLTKDCDNQFNINQITNDRHKLYSWLIKSESVLQPLAIVKNT